MPTARVYTGQKKKVFRASTRQGVPVVVKACKNYNGMGLGDELEYLTALRGMDGVPKLLGGWHSKGISTWVVRDTGGSTLGRTLRSAPLDNPKAAQVVAMLARTRPLALARAILACFHSFAELGGYFMYDFHPAQFTVAVLPDGAVSFELIDAPAPISGPLAPESSSGLSRSRADHGKYPFGVRRAYKWTANETTGATLRGGYDLNYISQKLPCRDNADCVRHGTTKAFHCCCALPSSGGSGLVPYPIPSCPHGLKSGAPETQGVCSSGTCTPISALTHVYDVAVKPWLLPLLVDHSDVVRDLIARMARPSAADRISFSRAIELLDAASSSAERRPSRA